MPIDPNQIIMDVPLHRTVWKGQTTFEQNVLPNDYVWAQCQVAVCNTLDGPNNCQASYTPRPYPAEKFKMAAKGWDFTVDVVAYQFLAADCVWVYGSVDCWVGGVADEAEPLMILIDRSPALFGYDPPGKEWVINPAYFPPTWEPVPPNVVTGKVVEDSLSGTYNGTGGLETFKPGYSWYPRYNCYQREYYGESNSVSYVTRGESPTPAPEDEVIVTIRRIVSPIDPDTMPYYDSYTLRDAPMDGSVVSYKWNVGYIRTYSYAVFSSALPPSSPGIWTYQRLLKDCSEPMIGRMVGKFWRPLASGETPPENWVQYNELIPGGYPKNRFTPYIVPSVWPDPPLDPPQVKWRADGYTPLVGQIFRDEINTSHSWRFGDGSMFQSWHGSHYHEAIANTRLDLDYCELLSYSKVAVYPAKDATFYPTGSSRTVRAYRSNDPKCFMQYLMYLEVPAFPIPDPAPTPEDYPILGTRVPVPVVYAQGSNGSYSLGSPSHIVDATYKLKFKGADVSYPGFDLSTIPDRLPKKPIVEASWNYAEYVPSHNSALAPAWSSAEKALKLTVYDCHLRSPSLSGGSQNTYELVASNGEHEFPAFPEEVFPAPFILYRPAQYGYKHPGDTKPVGAWVYGDLVPIPGDVPPEDHEWIRTYHG